MSVICRYTVNQKKGGRKRWIFYGFFYNFCISGNKNYLFYLCRKYDVALFFSGIARLTIAHVTQLNC